MSMYSSNFSSSEFKIYFRTALKLLNKNYFIRTVHSERRIKARSTTCAHQFNQIP